MYMEDQRKSQLLRKIVQSDGLPALSPLAIRLVEMATDDRKSARDLAEIIEKDPALTTRLLKLAGSAFFARPGRVASISQAIVFLGFKRVRLMALTLSLRDAFATDQKGGMDYNHFWKTSLYRALIAQDLALTTSSAALNPEEAFVGGLLLEIGQLILYSALSEPLTGFPGGDKPLEAILSWEEDHLGIHHRKVGALVLKRWGFPDELVESQRRFGEEGLVEGLPRLCKVVELARQATEIVFGQTDGLYHLHRSVQAFLSLKKEAVDDILSRSFRKMEELGEQLRIEVDAQKDIIWVMEKANLALARLTASLDTSIQGLLARVRDYDDSLTQISQAAAQGRQEALSNTLDAVAHEIRNPLLSIGGFAERLARHASEQERTQQYAGIIAKESRRLERVLKDIVGYAQAYVPSLAENDLASLVNEVIEEFDDLFREKSIRVVRDYGCEPVIIPVDRDGMIRVLRQFVKNAAQAMPQDGGEMVFTLGPGTREGEVFLSISDDGTPVSDEVRDLLLDSNLSSKTFEQGLEFPLARKIVAAHRGRIELNDPADVGNTVKLFLPTRRAPRKKMEERVG